MLLLNGTITDHSGSYQAHLRITDEIISEISPTLTPQENEEILDCTGKDLLPALIDIGIYPKNKSLSSSTLSSLNGKCLQGGVGSVLLYGDLHPLCNDANTLELIGFINSTLALNVFSSIHAFAPDGRIADIASLKSCGAKALHCKSQDLEGYNLLTLLNYAKMLNLPLILMPHDAQLANGVIDAGSLGAQMGLPSIPSIAWSKEVAKLGEISRFFCTPMLLTLADPKSIDYVKFFNTQGAQLLLQTSIHHLALEESHIQNYNTKAKIFPPLKNKASREALLQKICDGEIDCITSLQNATYNSHKDQVFELASSGIDTINEYFSLLYTYLVRTKIITLAKLSAMTSYHQAKFLNLPCGELSVGKRADILVADLEQSTICQDNYSPYFGQELYGKINHFILKGKIYE